jgi:hypothetical protein
MDSPVFPLVKHCVPGSLELTKIVDTGSLDH